MTISMPRSILTWTVSVRNIIAIISLHDSINKPALWLVLILYRSHAIPAHDSDTKDTTDAAEDECHNTARGKSLRQRLGVKESKSQRRKLTLRAKGQVAYSGRISLESLGCFQQRCRS